MPDPHQIQPLDYRRPPGGRPKYVEDAEARKWRRRRVLLRLTFVPIGLIITVLGCDALMFGHVGGLTSADFIPYAQRCIPVVRAMKEYQRDTGHLPQTRDDLEPTYIPKDAWIPGSIDQGHFSSIGEYNHAINYDFTPASEHWEVSGPLVSGRIPLPPVTIGPTTAPWVQP
ncbi:MAG TPA: hypothetical protein VHY37_09625 [Tepidisphaeraceae bacterium]|jgi:hypothetical protein|nr:hypothetical protein [Tepidisphaeraceae bacterium]